MEKENHKPPEEISAEKMLDKELVLFTNIIGKLGYGKICEELQEVYRKAQKNEADSNKGARLPQTYALAAVIKHINQNKKRFPPKVAKILKESFPNLLYH